MGKGIAFNQETGRKVKCGAGQHDSPLFFYMGLNYFNNLCGKIILII